jgi:hypothetical protein
MNDGVNQNVMNANRSKVLCEKKRGIEMGKERKIKSYNKSEVRRQYVEIMKCMAKRLPTESVKRVILYLTYSIQT